MKRRLLISLVCLSLLLSACLPDTTPDPNGPTSTAAAVNSPAAGTTVANDSVTDTPGGANTTPQAGVKPTDTLNAVQAKSATATPVKGATQPAAASATPVRPTITPNPAFTATVTKASTVTATPGESSGDTPTPYLTATLGPTVNPDLQVAIVPFNEGSWVISNYLQFEVDGNHIITGEVQNNDTSAQGGVEITALTYDSKGFQLDSISVTTLADVIPAKGKTTFRVEVSPWDKVRSVMLQASGSAVDTPRQDLTVVSKNATPSASDVTVEGSVQNTGSSAASSVQVIVTLYDKLGRVIDGTASDTNPDQLAANATGTYKVTLNHIDGYDHFAVQVVGH